MSKICKKRVHGNDKKNLPWDFKKCPGLLNFPLLEKYYNKQNNNIKITNKDCNSKQEIN